MHRRTILAAFPASLAALSSASTALAQTPSSTTSVERATIAVSRVRVDPAVARTLPASFSDNVLTREIEAALDATNRFTVVSRSAAAAEARADEQAVTGGGNVAAQRAQFLLAAEVLGMDLRQETRPVPNLAGKSATSTVGRLELRIEIERNSGRTREIRSRFPIEARVSTQPIVHDTHSPPGAGAASVGFVDLAREMGLRIADRIRDEIYPVQIIARQGDQVFLNRGQDSGYRSGESLRVFSGEAGRLIDPETGEDLGAQEMQIGTIEVTDIRPRTTTARIVTETSAIDRGNIVRR